MRTRHRHGPDSKRGEMFRKYAGSSDIGRDTCREVLRRSQVSKNYAIVKKPDTCSALEKAAPYYAKAYSDLLIRLQSGNRDRYRIWHDYCTSAHNRRCLHVGSGETKGGEGRQHSGVARSRSSS